MIGGTGRAPLNFYGVPKVAAALRLRTIALRSHKTIIVRILNPNFVFVGV